MFLFLLKLGKMPSQGSYRVLVQQVPGMQRSRKRTIKDIRDLHGRII